jgi:hypothetical protein
MKYVTAVALIVGANVALIGWGYAPLVWTASAPDGWSRSCRYYYPVRVFEKALPLSQSCPHWRLARAD